MSVLNFDNDQSSRRAADYFGAMAWMKIETAPFDRDLELAVIEVSGDAHAVVFPCRRTPYGWIKSETGRPVELHPTHWRNWELLDSRD